MGATADGRPAPDVRPPSPFVIRAGVEDDAAAAARLHVAGIHQGFLSFLGPAFLARLYRRIVHQPGCFLLVAADPEAGSGNIAGFIAGSDDVGRLYRSFLLCDGLVVAVRATGRLLRSVPQVFETLRHGMGGGESGRGTELLAVAVDASRRGHGVGRALVDSFLQQVVSGGGEAAHVVVGSDNAAALELYRRAGFVDATRFEMHAGTPSLLLQWNRSLDRSSE